MKADLKDIDLISGILLDRRLFFAAEYCNAGYYKTNFGNLNTEAFGVDFTVFLISLFDKFNIEDAKGLWLLICALEFEIGCIEDSNLLEQKELEVFINDLNEISRLMKMNPINTNKTQSKFSFAFGSHINHFKSSVFIDSLNDFFKKPYRETPK
jgi:hypothetical protein